MSRSGLGNLSNNRPSLAELYQLLLSHYGHQGWWPLLRLGESQQNPTARGRFTWYHPENYTIPSTEADIFEIMVGGILTQNTSWENADKALGNLQLHGILDIDGILNSETDKLAEIIRSSGYYNQKAIKLQNLAKILCQTPISKLTSFSKEDLRSFLLEIKGIGPETADSIILYGFHIPSFVVDTYTRRLLLRMGYIDPPASYEVIQAFFQSALPTEESLYNEYHALIVQHMVHVCKKKPKCGECMIQDVCAKILPPSPPRKKSHKKKKTRKKKSDAK
ncbi:MAG: endonuclease III domain-containing protein [Promethearchaeota archaeon]